jgi:hypothetical protein
MKVKDKWECEMCGKGFDTPYAVRDEVAICNGGDTRGYAYVCSGCIKRLTAILDEQFLNNKYAERIREKERIASAVSK